MERNFRAELLIVELLVEESNTNTLRYIKQERTKEASLMTKEIVMTKYLSPTYRQKNV